MPALHQCSLNVLQTARHCQRGSRPTQAVASQYTRALFNSAHPCCKVADQDPPQRQHPSQGPNPSLGPRRHVTSYTATGAHPRSDVIKQRPTDLSSVGEMAELLIYPMFESRTGTFQYIVTDPSSKATAIIDPVLGFEPSTQAISTQSADALLRLVAEKGYEVQYILETHAHADHLSATSYLQAKLSKRGTRPDIGIGKRIGQVQKLFGARYGVPVHEQAVAFTKLFEDDETFSLGCLKIQALHLSGHTPDHIGYAVGSNVFCGDSLFHVDVETARTDFPGGSAHDLWTSAQKLLSLPDDTKIWTGHDYPPEGRGEPVPFMTVREHREQNKHVRSGMTEEEFVEVRKERDTKLMAPRLLHQSLQINVRGGRLPEMDDGGRRMMRVPLKVEVQSW